MLCVQYHANPASKFQIAWGCFTKLGSVYFDVLHFCKTAYKMHDILGYAVNLQYEYLKNEIPDILSKYNFKELREALKKKRLKIPHSSLFQLSTLFW